MNWFVKRFEELSLTELYEMIQLREKIFVVEQDCPYLDCDGKDQEAFHVIGKQNDKVLSTARILAPGISYPEVSIGRVCNDASLRGTGNGKRLMKESISFCLEHFDTDIRISAQEYLDRFYTELGFEKTGKHYLEDGIPHQEMILKK